MRVSSAWIWIWRWMARPGWMLVLAQAGILAVFVALGWMMFLRQERDAVAQLSAELGRCEAGVLALRRSTAAATTPARLNLEIRRMGRQLAAYGSQRWDHQTAIALFNPGEGGTFAWRAPPGEGLASDRWTVTVTTDYAGLSRIMRTLAAEGGGRSLHALSVVRQDRRLLVEFTLTQPALGDEQHE